jgi:putative FmdB family regulatory protein
MPLYEYECQSCHRRTEKIQKFSDPELTVCPYCDGPLERTLTAPAVHFSGGGWYKDLYSSAKPAAANGDSAAKSDAQSGGTKSDAAPASSGTADISASAAPSTAAPAASSTPAASTPATSAPATSSKG